VDEQRRASASRIEHGKRVNAGCRCRALIV
jgi:hypothetical protein